MNVVAFGLDFVVVLFPLQVHQVQLVDESKFFEEFKGPVHRGPVDIWFAFSCKLQQGCGIEVLFGLLNDFNEDTALRRQTHALGGKFVQ